MSKFDTSELSRDEKIQWVEDMCDKVQKNSSEMASLYNRWATHYEKDMQDIRYKGPEECAKTMAKLLKDKNAKILDVAAGTGLVGLELSKHGFTNVHALDGSEGMLKEAAKKNVYKEIICKFVFPTATPGIEENSYDAVVTVASIAGNHLKLDIGQELCRIAKPGGYVLIITGEEEFPTPEPMHQLESNLDSLTDQCKWKLIEREVFPNWYSDENGLKLVFQVL